MSRMYFIVFTICISFPRTSQFHHYNGFIARWVPARNHYKSSICITLHPWSGEVYFRHLHCPVSSSFPSTVPEQHEFLWISIFYGDLIHPKIPFPISLRFAPISAHIHFSLFPASVHKCKRVNMRL